MIKGALDLTCSVGQLLRFPEGLTGLTPVFTIPAGGPVPVWGVLVAAPILRSVDNPLDVLPEAAIIWSSVLCTARGNEWKPYGAESAGARRRVISNIMSNINTLLTIRTNESMNVSPYRAKATEKEKQWACEKIVELGLQPCQILFEEGTRWVWVHPDDVVIPEQDLECISSSAGLG